MRDREQVIRDFVQQWLKKAETDLRTAKILLDTEAYDYYPCSFHAQQAVEKFLKAFLVHHQIEFRKTHDLDEIMRLVEPVDSALRDEISSCVWLTPYGVEFRYPGEYPEVDYDTAERAYADAELVKECVMKRLEHFLSDSISNNN